MAHNINTYIGRQSAWHKLGTVTGKYSTWAEILNHGGLDYTVVKDQLEHAGKPVEAWGTFRRDNGAFLGPVGKDYTVIDHARGFEMIDSLVASQDGAHYETAGVLGAGEVVWGLADLSLNVRVGDDVSKGYLLFATSYDGRFSHQYRQTLTRVVCQNTLNAAMSTKASACFRVRHTRNANARLDDAHAALNTIAGEFRTVEEKLNFLAQRKVTRETMVSVLDRLFPKSKDENGEDRKTTRRENILADVLRLYESNDRNAFPEQRGTAYNLLNAVTEYTDHYRSSKGGALAESAMFGSGDRLKSQALEVITLAASSMPAKPAPAVYRTVEAPRPMVAGGLLDEILMQPVCATA